MKDALNALQSDALNAIEEVDTIRSLEDVRLAFLGKKGKITALSSSMRELKKEDRPAFGALLNTARQAITEALKKREHLLQERADAASVEGIDPSMPARSLPTGSLHPLTQVAQRAIGIFSSMGFSLAKGPEIETEFHCFDALNTPHDHPARNEKDTFYFDSGKLLRTHTSSVQIRTMEKARLPVRIISPGSAYRRDEIDATHLSAFNQIEGLYVNQHVSLGELKGTLQAFFHALFGEETPVRFRPHFFPFTEPSFEIDVALTIAGKQPKWIEIAGCGMVDPAVFESVCSMRGDKVFDPQNVSGFAFGMGLERLAMILWSIQDIRLLIENDLRFLSQFSS